MLHRDDNARFKEHLEAAQQIGYEPAPPSEILYSDDGLYPAELFRLTQSLQIAAVADADLPQDKAALAARILNQVWQAA